MSVYAEVRDGRASVFVRDWGAGFDPAAVAPDRHGVRESIIGRMARHGGKAVVAVDRPARAPRWSCGCPGEPGGTRPPRPRVFLVDDHELFRSGVRAELGDAVDVVGEASEVEAAVEMILERRPDVVLLDVHLPDGGGRAVVAAGGAQAPDVRFLALSVSDAAEDVIGVIRAGARGYVTKTISGPELADAIRRVADGDVVFSRRLAGFVLDAFARRRASRGATPSSTSSRPGSRRSCA